MQQDKWKSSAKTVKKNSIPAHISANNDRGRIFDSPWKHNEKIIQTEHIKDSSVKEMKLNVKL